MFHEVVLQQRQELLSHGFWMTESSSTAVQFFPILVTLESQCSSSSRQSTMSFTMNRSKLKALAIELENVISSRNNLASPSKDSLQTDFSVYQAQLRLFLNCLEIVSQEKSEAVNTASVVSTSTTDPSIIVTLKDQFFDSLITGALKPSDLAHCQDVKTLESIVKRARIAEKAHVKISSTLSSSVNNNVNKSSSSSHPSSTQTSAPTSVENKTSTNNEPIDTTSEHGKHLYDMHCKRCTTHGQKKPSMKQSSLSSLLHPSKKSIPSASSDPGVSSLSMKTEPVDSSSGSTPLGGKVMFTFFVGSWL
ncbi:unnamed protein product [Trichobilharzia regenti]|nr:unnamed protein product [Trichobilharzia regenti]